MHAPIPYVISVTMPAPLNRHQSIHARPYPNMLPACALCLALHAIMSSCFLMCMPAACLPCCHACLYFPHHLAWLCLPAPPFAFTHTPPHTCISVSHTTLPHLTRHGRNSSSLRPHSLRRALHYFFSINIFNSMAWHVFPALPFLTPQFITHSRASSRQQFYISCSRQACCCFLNAITPPHSTRMRAMHHSPLKHCMTT